MTRTGERAGRVWSTSIGLGLVTALLLTAYALLWMPVVHGDHAWIVAGDWWEGVTTGRQVAYGALGYVYQQGHGFYALPLLPILLAPAVAVGDHLGLVQGYPLPVAHPTLWLAVGPYALLWGILLLYAIRRAAWEYGIRDRLWAVQLIGVIAVLVPCGVWGHPEDVLALTGLLASATCARQGRLDRAAVALALAISAKQWALLAIPFLLLAVPAGRRLRAVVLSVSLPAVLAGFVLAVDWPDASRALLAPTVPTNIPFGHHGPLVLLGTTASRPARVLALLLGPLAAWSVRRRPGADTLLFGLGAALLSRALLEPVVFAYYFSPGIAVLALALIARSPQRWLAVLGWVTLASAWSLPRSPATLTWWCGELVILAAGGVLTTTTRVAERHTSPRLASVHQ